MDKKTRGGWLAHRKPKIERERGIGKPSMQYQGDDLLFQTMIVDGYHH